MYQATAFHRSASTRPAALTAARPLARVALSCGVAAALAAGVSGTATAAERPGAEKAPAPAASAAAQGRQGQAQGQNQGAERRQQAASAAQDSHRATEVPAPAAKGSKGSTQAPHQQRTADPAGNNGTVKVDGAAWDTRVDNEPHVSCAFRVTLFGFDEGQTANITVTGIAPTGGGVLLQDNGVPTSADLAGGAANDYDGATRTYTADDLGLTGVAPHPKQGYHIKVAVDSVEAPGGAKQKVLWLQPCDASEEAPLPETGELPAVPGDTPTPTPTPATETPEQSGVLDTPVVGTPPVGEVPAVEVPAVPAVEVPAVPAVEVPAASAVPAVAAMVPAASTTRQAGALPRELAWTGAAGLALMTLLGAGAAASGSALQVVRRRLSATE